MAEPPIHSITTDFPSKSDTGPTGPIGSIPNVENKTSPLAEANQITFSGELLRKMLHLGSLSIPVIYYFVSRETAIRVLLPIAVFSIFIDVSRHYIPAIARIVKRLFDRIIRPHERKNGLLSGATYVFISALFCVLVFPKLITITAFSILIVSDASSALVGRAYGRHRFFDKSLEGSLAFIISAWLVILLTPKAGPLPIEYAIAAIAAVIGGMAEAASVTLHLDDNFSVPVSIGFVMWGLYLLLDHIDPTHYASLYQSLLHIS
jgi:dolichol kinase